MCMAGKHLKKPEYSKIISSIAIAFWLIVNAFGMFMIAVTLDMSQLMYIIGSADAVVAVVYAVYSHKAKAENMIKLKKQYGSDADTIINNYTHTNTFVDDMEAATLKF